MAQTATPTQTMADLALTAEVRAAVQTFAAALADTPEWQTFEDAAIAFKHDRAAQEAVRVFQEKQRSLQMMQQLGMLEQKELNELDCLRDAMMDQPRVRAYVDAQNELTLLCQAAAKELSEAIGLDFASACAPGCC
jgi:cell fate (sporulation/competence/biofilm development) regulator YlbF (YheA/YmcA/DUF963 family)